MASHEYHDISNRRQNISFIQSFVGDNKTQFQNSLLPLCEGNPPVTGGFPQKVSNTESIFVSWRQHAIGKSRTRLAGRIKWSILAVGMRVWQYDYCHNTAAFWLQDDIWLFWRTKVSLTYHLREMEQMTHNFLFVDIVISVGKTTFYRFCVSSFGFYHSSDWNCSEIPDVLRHFEWRHLVTEK